MGIQNGQPVDETYTNPAFLDRRLDDTAFGRVTLGNTTDPTSGLAVANAQQHINDLMQNDKLILHSLTHMKISYSGGVLTFPENLVVRSPDFLVVNQINIPVPNVNIADGQSMYISLSRYSSGTVSYTVGALPKGKDIFRVCTRVGDAVIFWPNILVPDGSSIQLGAASQAQLKMDSTINGTIAGLVNGVNTSFQISNLPDSDLYLQQDGIPLVPVVDYTRVGQTITLTVAPGIGANLYAYYAISGTGQSGLTLNSTTDGTIVGNVDGVNTLFVVQFFPVNDVFLMKNSLPLIENTDYTRNGVNITLSTAPTVGQNLFAFYSKT